MVLVELLYKSNITLKVVLLYWNISTTECDIALLLYIISVTQVEKAIDHIMNCL